LEDPAVAVCLFSRIRYLHPLELIFQRIRGFNIIGIVRAVLIGLENTVNLIDGLGRADIAETCPGMLGDVISSNSAANAARMSIVPSEFVYLASTPVSFPVESGIYEGVFTEV